MPALRRFHRSCNVNMALAGAVGGMLPLFLALGAGAEMRAPMARAVVGGIITSTLLTLVVIPVFFDIMDDFTFAKAWSAAKRKLGQEIPAEPVEAPRG